IGRGNRDDHLPGSDARERELSRRSGELVLNFVWSGLEENACSSDWVASVLVPDNPADHACEWPSGCRATFRWFAGLVPVVEESRGIRVVDDTEPELFGVGAQPGAATDDLFKGDD